MQARKAFLVGAIVATGLVAAGTAQSGERRCDGLIGPETVPDNLVVPSGETCDLGGTVVLGNVTVEPDAVLLAAEADLRGNLTVGSDSFVDLLESTVAGTLELRDSFGVLIGGGSIGNLDSNGSELIRPFGATIAGNVKVVGGSTTVTGNGLAVGGNLEATGIDLFDLSDSTVNGTFAVRGTGRGSFFCNNTLNGNSEFTSNRTELRIGAPGQACGGNRLNGNIVVARNQAQIEISDNDVGGNLTCRGNSPPPVGGGNRVQGNKEGQCRAL
jgi:hypothetical protein